jgi:hypothetical protein
MKKAGRQKMMEIQSMAMCQRVRAFRRGVIEQVE